MAKLFESPRYIAVEGPIRVGKSTLARILGERLNAQRVVEPEDNQFLRAFYDGEPGAAFQAQLTFLIRRFEQLRSLDLSAHSRRTAPWRLLRAYLRRERTSPPQTREGGAA